MFKYNRILIIGCSASGKSTFSRRLSEITNIPVIHLDRLYWKKGWVEENPEVFKRRLKELVCSDKWIIDGNYSRTLDIRLQRSDLVLRYKIGRAACISGYIKRLLLNKERPDMADGCTEHFDWEFFKYIWNFSKTQDKKTDKILKKYHNVKVITFYSRKQAEYFLEKITYNCK